MVYFGGAVLCDEHMPGLWVHVSAEVRDGCLRVSGQDLGSRVEEIMGRDEYEYFMDLDMKNTDRLFALLSTDKKDPKETFIQNFSGLDGCRLLREFCEKNKIKYKFSTF